MQALDALRHALDVQQTTARGVVPTGAPATPIPSARISDSVDRVTFSARALALAEGEPTDLEGTGDVRTALGPDETREATRPAIASEAGGSVDSRARSYGSPSASADLEAGSIDLFA